MNISIDVTENKDEYLVTVKGELDVYTAPELKQVFEPIAATGEHNLIVDLSELNYMDSTGLGIFVGTLKDLNKHNKELHVLGVNDRIMKLFEITGLRDLMYVNKNSEVEE
ncbi:STAS domain-containing protein [Jeotgalicoccus huakuii]|uniref:STAS domain-containing protein n=2 Tax=Jeotgalicoccus TaxID=227979 RepID=UPI001414FC57|nr:MULTISPECIES: STAS domain-containing protein [unclassified Jeotgalicoccus]MCK1975820.1 STAS domain-containing protein [Jeotgalicoccus huakuii]QQD84892.1 STAS domain-containing protein [Jeotgalicoccus sp. ATCC 8456]